jgi:glyoxylase-like metal-dependent hydrolase (beta-lactamase superfamily II)
MTIRMGAFGIHRIEERVIPFTHAQAFFPDLTQEMLETCMRELPTGNFTADGILYLSFHAHIVRTPRYTIVVDTCCGNDKVLPSAPQFANLQTPFLAGLQAAGIRPEEVDFVMCTHLHFDHVGWNTQLIDGSWRPTFPNAKYIISKDEYNYWDGLCKSGVVNIHTDSFKQSVHPVERAGNAILVDHDYQLDDGIWMEPCPGHTPGNVLINLASEGSHSVILGDVIHHQLQLRFPEISSRADEDKVLARSSRMALIERYADSSSLMLPAHFPPPSVGRILSAEPGGYKFEFVT